MVEHCVDEGDIVAVGGGVCIIEIAG
jgi:hypothetical protein